MRTEHGRALLSRSDIEVDASENVREFGAKVDPKDPEIVALSESIKQVGLLHPVVVRRFTRENGRWTVYKLLAGFRRMAACDLAGLDKIPATIIETRDPLDLLSIQCESNTHGKPLTPAEIAFALLTMEKAALESGVLHTQADLCRLAGVSPQYGNALFFCVKRLIPPIMAAWKQKAPPLPLETARMFAAMPPSEQARKWQSFVGAGGASLDDSIGPGQRTPRRTTKAISSLATELDGARLVKVGGQWEPASERERQIIRGVLSWVLSSHAEKPIR